LGISDEAPGMMPISKERHTLGQTDFKNNDDMNDQRLLIKNYKEEKIIKLAIMDKLEQILDEKLKMLKAEKVKASIIIQFIKGFSHKFLIFVIRKNFSIKHCIG
jgi:hypothetical protein